MEATHSLALKVMRLSRPSLAIRQPTLTTLPGPCVPHENDFQQLLLAGASSDPNRLTCAAPKNEISLGGLHEAAFSPLLTLPAAFGTICLGETFAATLNLSNETAEPVNGVRLLVEMQSVSGKHLIEEKAPGAAADILRRDEAMELGVEWEIKELGMHVLVCTVEYGTAPSTRSFQKFYKFNVSPPLSIKTRVHLPSSPNATLLQAERSKVFLEVHIQNTSPASVTFDRLFLEPVAGLTCSALECESGPANKELTLLLNDSQVTFNGPFGALLPRNTRQYLFVLSPSPASTSVETQNPGTIVPLGRLDVTWRSTPFGEKGRLLTSVLNRRVPGVPPNPLASRPSVPPHLQLARVASSGGRASPQPPPLPPKQHFPGRVSSCSICVASYPTGGVEVEERFSLKVILSLRRRKSETVKSLPTRFALQYIPPSDILMQQQATLARTTVAPPEASYSRAASPNVDGRSNLPSPPRPFSPSSANNSRPLTPVSSQLRMASTSSISAPAAGPSSASGLTLVPAGFTKDKNHYTSSMDATGTAVGRVCLMGPTFVSTSPVEFTEAPEKATLVEADHAWEDGSVEAEFHFMAWSAGLVDLGGIIVIEWGDEYDLRSPVIGSVETLGSIWIHA